MTNPSAHLLKTTFLLLFISLVTSSVNAQASLPLQPGYAGITCFSGVADGSYAPTNPDGYVVGIYDIREPDCSGNTPNATDNWATASASVYHHSTWIARNLGEVFGIDFEDNVTNPNIYVSSYGITDVALAGTTLATGGSGGDVFKLNGTTGAITKIVSLPNTTFTYGGFDKYVGLGNLSYNIDDNVLYVTNFDDGLIYVVNESTGAILDTYDHNPTLSNDPNRYMSQLTRLPFGVAYNKCENRLYYAVVSDTQIVMPPNGDIEYAVENTIYSVALNADGTIDDSSIRTEVTVASNNQTFATGAEFSVISDIEFSQNCDQILFSEQTLYVHQNNALDVNGNETGLYEIGAHKAQVFRYSGSSQNWSSTVAYVVGEYTNETNGAGGADFGYSNYGSCGVDNACLDAVVIMGDALLFDQANNQYNYGLQISDYNGNDNSSFPSNSYFVDLDGVSTGDVDKTSLGDVDVFAGDCAPPCSVTASTIASDQTVCSGEDPVAFTVSNAATGSGTLTYQWQSSTTDCSSGFSNIDAATSATYDAPSGLSQTTYYRVIVNNDDLCADTSNCVMITVNPLPTAITASIALCDDGDGTVNFDLTSVESTVTGGASGVSVAWFSDMNLTTSIGTPAAYASSSGTVYAQVINTNCPTSEVVTLTVYPAINAANPGPTIACTNSIDTINGYPVGGSGTYTTHTWTDLNTGTASGYTLNFVNSQKMTVDASSASTGTINLQYYVEDDNGCSYTATNHTVTITEPDTVRICNDTTNYAVLYADTAADLTNVIWYNSADMQVGMGDSLEVDTAIAGMEDGMDSYYYAANDSTGCAVGLCCPVLVIAENCATQDSSDYLDDCVIDPCHIISENIYLGDTVTADASAIANANASGDADDGVRVFSSLDVVPGGSFRLPVTMYNNTGSDAYLYIYVDWNGNNNFGDPSETLMSYTYPTSTYSGSYTEVIDINVPANLNTTQIGLRFRYSTDNSANASGVCGTGTCASDGEVEDYIIPVNCQTNICLPTTISIRRGK